MIQEVCKKFLEEDRCPICNSDDIERYGDQEILWQDAVCNSCEGEWEWNDLDNAIRITKIGREFFYIGRGIR